MAGVDPVTPATPDAGRKHNGTEYVTGAYQPSGDVGVDRLLQLERALKQFGSPF